MVKNLLAMQETQVWSLFWVRKIPWRKEWQPTPVFLPGEFYGQRSLVGYSPRGHKRVRHDWATNTFTFTDTTPPTLHLYSVTLDVCLSCVLSCFSCVCLFATLWTVACQASLSMGSPRQEYWSVLLCPPPGDLADPEIKPDSLALLAVSCIQWDSLRTDLPGKLSIMLLLCLFMLK